MPKQLVRHFYREIFARSTVLVKTCPAQWSWMTLHNNKTCIFSWRYGLLIMQQTCHPDISKLACLHTHKQAICSVARAINVDEEDRL